MRLEKLFQDNDQYYNCEIVTLFGSMSTIGGLIIISDNKNTKLYAEILFEIFRGDSKMT